MMLYKQTTTGKIQSWEVSVNGNVITTTYGLMDGEKQVATDIIKEGKNIGKVNETTPEEQAEIKSKQMYEKKIKSGYTPDLNAARGSNNLLDAVKPMLAYPIQGREDDIKFPCIVQPKLDGLRCIIIKENDEVKLYSRTQKLIETVPHINAEVKHIFKNYPNIILDGELYNHQFKDDFNTIVSLIKRDEIHPQAGEYIQFHWYDTVQKGEWYKRNDFKDLKDSNTIVKVPTYTINSKETLYELQGKFIEDGYEGLMYRDMKMEYEHKRSKGLLKVKTFLDDEFDIIGVEEGHGKLMGKAGSFICQTKDGKKFNAKMVGSIDSLTEYLVNFNKYLGKKLTVKYFQLTVDGIPRFPVGLRIRESE